MISGPSERPRVVYGAIGANLIVAVAAFVAVMFTGGSAMLSAGIHSVADTGNQLLLLLSVTRGRRPSDDLHPFGHGKELHSWGRVPFVIVDGEVELYTGKLDDQKGGEGEEGS